MATPPPLFSSFSLTTTTFPSSSTIHLLLQPSAFLPASTHRGWLQWNSRKRTRAAESVVVRAGGPPSSSNFAFAFVFPLSLIIGTVFASIRIADRLDEKYLEELAINQAIMEEKEAAEEEENNNDIEDNVQRTDEDDSTPDVEEQAVVEVAASPATRRRNRPRKEV